MAITPYYEQDGITIYHGDALEVLPTLPRHSVDAVITDPPYIIGAVSSGTMASKAGGWADMMNSALWFTTWYRMVDRLLRNDGVFWSFLNWRSLPVVMRAAVDAGLPITSCAVWDKEWIGPGGVQGLRPSYEMIALLCRPDFAIPDRGVADVLKCKVGSFKPTGHPAEKPKRLLDKLIAVSGLARGSLVVDPFLGSGTTAHAAYDAGMRFVGVESEERYCEIAAKRLAQGVFDFAGAPV